MKKILVIEDEPKHKQDAEKFFGSKSEIEVIYASNYYDSMEVMDYWRRKDINGIISDIYFPLTSNEKWNQPEPIGIRIAVESRQAGIPFVLITSGYHHGRRYQWIHEFAGNQNWAVIDAPNATFSKDADSKDWKRAYESLEEKMKG